MKRRESGKSARHARRDGWRAALLTMLKYCCHKTTPKFVIENTRFNENARLRQDGTFDHDSRTAQQSGREYCIPVFLKTYGSDVAYATEAAGDKVPRRMSFRTFSEHPARTVEPALFLGRKRLDGVAWCRVRQRKGGRRRRVTHGPPVMRDPVVAGGQGRLPEHQQSGECRRGP
jgi:hypothetical protein